MERIKEGIVEIDGIELTPETTLSDLESIDIDKAIQHHHSSSLEVIFNRPLENDGVNFRVSVRMANKDNKKIILLDPIFNMPVHGPINESRQKQEVCEEWLKRNMDIEPDRDTDDGIFYDFPWGHIYSAAAEHIHFGHLSGCIQMIYGEPEFE